MVGSKPVIGGFYRHNNGKLYQVRDLAINADTGGRMVVYQLLSDDFATYVCTVDDFMGITGDGSYHFTPVESHSEAEYGREAPKAVSFRSNGSESGAVNKKADSPSSRELSIRELMLAFLDENDFEKKDEILSEIGSRPEITDSIIDNLAAAMDVVVDEGPLDKRLSGLRTCVRTRARYESTRLRR